MKTEDIAHVAHNANAALCDTQGDQSQLEWVDAPNWQKESAIAGVRAIRNGSVTEPRHAHEAWANQKFNDGWTYGLTKNPETKEHPCLVPFDQLPVEQQLKGHLFFAIVTTLVQHG